MTEQEIDLQDPRVLHRAAEHLTDRYAGVFFPELVERCVAECHAALSRQARISTFLAPMALHGAADRLRALAREQGDTSRTFHPPRRLRIARGCAGRFRRTRRCREPAR